MKNSMTLFKVDDIVSMEKRIDKENEEHPFYIYFNLSNQMTFKYHSNKEKNLDEVFKFILFGNLKYLYFENGVLLLNIKEESILCQLEESEFIPVDEGGKK